MDGFIVGLFRGEEVDFDHSPLPPAPKFRPERGSFLIAHSLHPASIPLRLGSIYRSNERLDEWILLPSLMSAPEIDSRAGWQHCQAGLDFGQILDFCWLNNSFRPKSTVCARTESRRAFRFPSPFLRYFFWRGKRSNNPKGLDSYLFS